MKSIVITPYLLYPIRRIVSVEDADLILVMENGRVVSVGTHTELLARHGFYYTLYNSQFAH